MSTETIEILKLSLHIDSQHSLYTIAELFGLFRRKLDRPVAITK